MVAVFPILYVGWKFFHKTRIYKPHEVDLRKNLDEVEEYERNYVPSPPGYVVPFPSKRTFFLQNVANLDRSMFERILDKIFG